jgi:hypothetical protein
MAAQLARAGTPAPKVIGIDEISIRKGHTYRIEPPRVCRRLQLLRDWSHDNRIKIPEVLCRGA